MTEEEKFPHYWICDACAKEKGGVWPKGHQATAMEDICPYCRGIKQLTVHIMPWVDFNWPKDIDSDVTAKMNRD